MTTQETTQTKLSRDESIDKVLDFLLANPQTYASDIRGLQNEQGLDFGPGSDYFSVVSKLVDRELIRFDYRNGGIKTTPKFREIDRKELQELFGIGQTG